jgi:hypothetical protein
MGVRARRSPESAARRHIRDERFGRRKALGRLGVDLTIEFVAMRSPGVELPGECFVGIAFARPPRAG